MKEAWEKGEKRPGDLAEMINLVAFYVCEEQLVIFHGISIGWTKLPSANSSSVTLLSRKFHIPSMINV